MVKAILKLLGKSEDLIEFVKDRLGHDFRYSLNTEKIDREFVWKAKVSFNTGIEKTVSWYIDNIAWVEGKLSHLRKYWSMAYK